MLNIETDIPNTIPGAGTTPFGQFKDDAFPGDESGTPLIQKWPNDIYYGMFATLFKAGLTPNGTNENISVSQFVDALTILMEQFQSSNFLNPTPQQIPNNTVKLSRGVTRDPDDPTSEPIIIPAGSADSLIFTGVTTDSRIDRLVFDKTGTITLKVGVQAAFPTPPALLEGEEPICRVLISTVGTPVIDNVADIITPERVINRLQRSLSFARPSKAVQSSRLTSAGNGVQLVPHGVVGQIPNKLTFHSAWDQINGASMSGTCIFNGTTFEQGCSMFSSATGVAKPFVKLGSVLHIQDNSGVNTYTGVVTGIDGTNVSITWTKSATAPPGEIDFVMISE